MRRLILASLVFLVQPVLALQSVYVEAVKGTSASEVDRSTVQELIRISVSQVKGFTTVSESAKSQLILSPTLLRLGDAFVLSLEKKDSSGKVLFAERMKAKLMSDLDTLASRLTEAVLSNTKFSDTANVTNITQEEETLNTRRYQATRQWVIGLGPGYSSNLQSKGGGFTFLLGYLWGLDPDFGVNLSWTIHSGPEDDDSSYTDFSLGAEHFFYRTKYSPYVGARLGYGTSQVNDCSVFSANCSSDNARGWSANATLGYKMFRTSNVNLAVFVSYFYLFSKNSLGNPDLTTVQLAVYY